VQDDTGGADATGQVVEMGKHGYVPSDRYGAAVNHLGAVTAEHEYRMLRRLRLPAWTEGLQGHDAGASRLTLQHRSRFG
jgi:hypothetical protein